MSLTKHKIFKIKLSDDGKFTITKAVERSINQFLEKSNNVYVNHSVTTLTEDKEEFDNLKTVCKYVLVSFIYKDLDSSPLSVKNTSSKIKSIVHKEIESGNAKEEPNIITNFDKEFDELINSKSQSSSTE